MATRKIPPAVNAGASSTLAGQVGATRQVLQVVSKRDGFRRAGREWHGTTTVQPEELTDAQLAQVKAEPMLVVLELDVPEESVGELAAADSLNVDAGTSADASQA